MIGTMTGHNTASDRRKHVKALELLRGSIMNGIARLVLPVIFACLAFPALAEKRVALVIGNAAYKHAPALTNPKNDAEGVAASLQRLRFDVLLGVDLDEA